MTPMDELKKNLDSNKFYEEKLTQVAQLAEDLGLSHTFIITKIGNNDEAIFPSLVTGKFSMKEANGAVIAVIFQTLINAIVVHSFKDHDTLEEALNCFNESNDYAIQDFFKLITPAIKEQLEGEMPGILEHEYGKRTSNQRRPQ